MAGDVSPVRGAGPAPRAATKPRRGAGRAAAASPPMDAAVYQTDDFRLYNYKVLSCAQRAAHEWVRCGGRG